MLCIFLFCVSLNYSWMQVIFLAVSTGCRAHGGPEPELPCWWAELGLRMCCWVLIWQAVGLQWSGGCCLPTGLWGWDLGAPRGGASHWWVELGPRASSCRVLGILGLVPGPWCLGLILCPLVYRAGSWGSCGLGS